MILHQDWDQTEIRLRSDWDQTQLATTIGCLVFLLVDLDFLYYTKGLIPWLGGFHPHDKHSFIVWSSFGAFNWCILLDLKQWYCVTCKPSRPLVSGRRVFFFFFFFPNLLDHRQKHHQTSGKTLSIQLPIFSSLTSTSIEIYAYFGFLSFFFIFLFFKKIALLLF